MLSITDRQQVETIKLQTKYNETKLHSILAHFTVVPLPWDYHVIRYTNRKIFIKIQRQWLK